VSWLEETVEELEGSLRRLERVAEEIRGEPTATQVHDVWLSYLYVEKGVAFIKLELGEENPGRFINIKKYDVPDERQAIGFAIKNLRFGLETVRRGDLGPSLKPLRESRNYLRALLRKKQLMRRRAASTRP